MNSPTGYTSIMLRNMCIWDAMTRYLKEGETREAILKQFSGNLQNAINFLRERSYENMEIIASEPKGTIKHEIIDKESDIFDSRPQMESKARKKKELPNKSSQKDLF